MENFYSVDKMFAFILLNRKTFIALHPHLLTISTTSTQILIADKSKKIQI